MGRIGGLNWQPGYMNDQMDPATVRALAEQGFLPDGSRAVGRLNGVLNPIRRALGVQTGAMPEGMGEVDYGALLQGFDGAMAGFGGADPSRTGRPMPPQPTKDQSRVPPARGQLDVAPPRPGSMALQRQMSGDVPPPARADYTDNAMRLMQQNRDVQAKVAAHEALVQALLNGNARRAPEKLADGPRDDRAPTLPATPKKAAGEPPRREQKASPPIPRARPTSYTVKKGDTLAAIAKKHGMTVRQLERRNPGITKRARRLRIGSEIKI